MIHQLVPQLEILPSSRTQTDEKSLNNVGFESEVNFKNKHSVNEAEFRLEHGAVIVVRCIRLGRA